MQVTFILQQKTANAIPVPYYIFLKQRNFTFQNYLVYKKGYASSCS